MSVDSFNGERLALWRALRVALVKERDNLWMAALLRPHMVLEHQVSKALYYVIRATKWHVSLLFLEGGAERAVIKAQHAYIKEGPKT